MHGSPMSIEAISANGGSAEMTCTMLTSLTKKTLPPARSRRASALARARSHKREGGARRQLARWARAAAARLHRRARVRG